MKKSLFLTALLLALSVTAFAQSSEKITQILESQKATYGHAAYLASVYAGYTDDTISYEKAAVALIEKSLIPQDTDYKSEISLKSAAYIFALTSDMKGGLWYSIKPSERYALKEIKAKGIVPDTADPSKKISGRDLIDLFSGVISLSAQESSENETSEKGAN